MCCSVLQCVLKCVELSCSARVYADHVQKYLESAVCCSVLQCAAVRCNAGVCVHDVQNNLQSAA